MDPKNRKKQAVFFLLFLGVVALFSDFVHEGGRSIYGNYLDLIGVSAFLISFIAGLGEFLGQALRVVTGYIADQTKKYWTMMFIGYAINLLSIPFLAFVDASIWQVALVLILLERVGKAIRAPAKSALVSFTTSQLGAGKAFAVQELLDQFGAFLGPIFVYFILGLKAEALSGYQLAFGALGIFAVVTLVLLLVARFKYPHPDQMETASVSPKFRGDLRFLLYMAAIVFIAMGFIDFPLISLHFERSATVPVLMIPLLYSLAMGVDAVSAIVFGAWFDKIGVRSLMVAIGLAALFAPLVFWFGEGWVQILGLVLWGVGMGAQESVLKSVIATIVPKERRATAYGIFYAVFGLFWFLGSLIVGWLYEQGLLTGMVVFSVIMELAGVFLLGLFWKRMSRKEPVQV
ncbi:MAG TPA: MFS transporter [Candidatus Izemoplasmatales bacterium]|nr:MFS transporter [Candidatus Izemoplasmatales bacterium]